MPHNGYETSLQPGTSPQATLTNEASLTCEQPISGATPNAICSPASADGLLPFGEPDGATMCPSGPSVAPARHGHEPASGHVETAGKSDHRDLWPVVTPLIRKLKPVAIYGEQVAGRKVEPWIGRTCVDLMQLGYGVRGEFRKANNFGAPAGRERFYFSANARGARGEGLVPSGSIGAARPWRWGGEEDLRAIADAPFEPGDRWPQPLVRRGDDGLSTRVASLRAYGNAIDPWIAAQFIAEANGA